MGSPVAFVTHHKCATTWLGWLLSRLCELNDLTLYRSHEGRAVPSRDHDLSLLTNSSYQVIEPHIGSVGPCIHVIRDPRSIVVSAYHSHLKTHPDDGWPELRRQRSVLQAVPEEEGMLLTLAYLESMHFYHDTPGPLLSLGQWNFDDDRIFTLRMEDIVDQTPWLINFIRGQLGRPELNLPDAGEFEFARFTGRQVGTVDETSHYRSGDPGAWRRELPPGAIAYIRAHYADFLSRFYPD